jgi:hypothetical protein
MVRRVELACQHAYHARAMKQPAMQILIEAGSGSAHAFFCTADWDVVSAT